MLRRLSRLIVPVSCLVVLILFGLACTSAGSPSPAPSAKPQSPSAASSAPAAAASSPAAKPTTPAKTATVRMGLVGSSSDAGMLIALEKGFFAEQGLDVKAEQFAGGSAMMAPLAAGQLDVGGPSPNGGLYNAVGRNITIKIVADKGSDLPGFGYQGLVIRKDLADKIKDYKDLKGLKIAFGSSGGGSADIVLYHALRKAGLTLKDLETLVIPYADMNTALRNASIDGAIHWEPQLSVGVGLGVSVDWRRADVIYPSHQSATIVYGEQFTKTQPEAANRWMVGYVKGVRYYNDAFRKGINKAEVLQILATATRSKPEDLAKTVPAGLNPDGYVNLKGLAEDVELLRELGYVQAALDIKQVVDNQYADYAVKQLGPYKY